MVKRMFKKSYLPNYMEEVFTIYKRFARQVPVYKLKDDAGEILEGTFYEPEIQKIMMSIAWKRSCARESAEE